MNYQNHPASQPVREIGTFRELWKGGFYEGDPFNPVGPSTYYGLGYMSVLHAVYQVCIKPYVSPTTISLEIGPGRGAWSKTLVNSKELWCLDALSAEHNNFWEYVGHSHSRQVKYIQVTDFSCDMLPDDHFDYLFSFGCFCHITWDGQRQYYTNLFRKLRTGAHAFVMFGDFEKYNRAIDNWRRLELIPLKPFSGVHHLKWFLRHLRPHRKLNPEDRAIAPGKWYHVPTSEVVSFLHSIGYRVISQDIGLVHRDPIIHFVKP